MPSPLPDDSRVPLERLDLEPMASGNPSIRLTERVTWDGFARYAEAVIAHLGGKIGRRADSPAERVWEIRIEGRAFWVAFDDFGLGVSLDPQDAEAGKLIPALRDKLLAWRQH